MPTAQALISKARKASNRVDLEAKTYGLPLSAGVRVLVLLGGFPDNHHHWQKQVVAFEADYHILSITTPDFDRPALRRRWGYEPAEVVTLLRACIDRALASPDRSFDLVAHDWGAYWGYLLVEQLAPSGRVRKLVAIEVGAGARGGNGGAPSTSSKATVRAEHPGQRGFLWTLPYQLTFATIFLVGTMLSEVLASVLMRLYIRFGFPVLGPLGRGATIVRAPDEIFWWMCWPYYQLWFNHVFRLRRPPLPRFPSCPTLFLWGERKRAFFHTGKFVAKLQSTEGCDAKSYDCSHWVHWEKAVQVNRDMRAFLLPAQ